VQAVTSAAVPSQAPPQVVPAPVQAVREPRGAPVTGEQVPKSPVTLQAWHWPVQALSQQKPSAQERLERHWSAAEQTAPLSPRGRQAPAEQ
jgi:hypothetical protein